MKQLAILIISVILVIGSGIVEIKYLENSSRYALTDIQYSKNAILNSNYKMAKDGLDAVEDTWKNMKDVWNIFIEHSEIDNIEENLVEYKLYIEKENEEESLVRANLLVRGFEHIVEKQRVHIGNIF